MHEHLTRPLNQETYRRGLMALRHYTHPNPNACTKTRRVPGVGPAHAPYLPLRSSPVTHSPLLGLVRLGSRRRHADSNRGITDLQPVHPERSKPAVSRARARTGGQALTGVWPTGTPSLPLPSELGVSRATAAPSRSRALPHSETRGLKRKFDYPTHRLDPKVGHSNPGGFPEPGSISPPSSTRDFS